MLKLFKQFLKTLLVISLPLLAPSVLHANTNIVILGDSLSSGYKMDPKLGWVNLMAESLKKCDASYKISNLSASGDTTRNGLTKIQLALEESPEIIVIELGGNDALRGYPLIGIRKNLKSIIETTLETKTKVLLVGIKIPPNYGGPYTEQFYQIYQDLSREYSLPFVDFLLEGVATNKQYMLSDGIHPNVQAQPLIAKHVWPTLIGMLPSENTQNCAY